MTKRMRRRANPNDPPAGFQRPFKLDEVSGSYIWDGNGQMAADFHGEDGAVRARGWGRIMHLTEPIAGPASSTLFLTWEAWLLDKTAGLTGRQAIVDALNEEPS